MPRSIWTGSISFGLVNVPVKVYSAVSQKDLHFNQFDKNGSRIRYKRVSEKTGREVDYDDIVKGYELSKGKFVLIDPEELEAFEPKATKTIDIEDFVDLEAIDPIYYEHTYYLAPAGDSAAKAYSLLLKAMEDKGKVAIGKVVMRTKQYLAAIRPLDGVLAMSTMLFADEVVPRKEIDALPARASQVPDKELKMAGQIIDSLASDWKPERYHDTYRERVMDYIEAKADGETIEVADTAESEPKIVDLMAALEASLAAAKGNKGSSGGTKAKKSAKPANKKAPATKKRASSAKQRTPAKAARKSA